MNDVSQKIRLIYVPFLIVCVGFVLTYTSLNWLLIIKTETVSVKEDIINFWLPFGLPWIPLLIWLRPRIRLISFDGDNNRQDRKRFSYYMLAAFAIAAPTIVAQHYITTATGKLTQLSSVREIDEHTKTKYYTLNNFYIDKAHPGVFRTSKVSGNRGQHLDFLIYVASPVFEKSEDTLAFKMHGDTVRMTGSSGVRVWLGSRFFKQVSNRLNQTEKESLYQSFGRESYQQFLGKRLEEFQYLDRIGNNDDRDGYMMATRRSYGRPPSFEDPIIVVPVNEAFGSQNSSTFPWVFGSFFIGAGLWLLLALIPTLDSTATEKFLSGERIPEKNLWTSFSFLIPRPNHMVTPIIIDMNLLVYLAMVFAGLGLVDFRSVDLLNWGANFRPLTSGGQWWRLISSIFLHGGLIHLIVNMYSLMFVGISLEPKLGASRFAITYFATGVFASIASMWWHHETVSVGASGAIFGLYGALLSLIFSNKHGVKSERRLLISMGIFVVYNLLFGLAIPSGIDNAAHIGGLGSGLLIGFFLAQTTEHGDNELSSTQNNGG
jgi:rhomboid protease GluP